VHEPKLPIGLGDAVDAGNVKVNAAVAVAVPETVNVSVALHDEQVAGASRATTLARTTCGST